MQMPIGATGGRTHCFSKMDISCCDSWRKMRGSASTKFWILFWRLSFIVKETKYVVHNRSLVAASRQSAANLLVTSPQVIQSRSRERSYALRFFVLCAHRFFYGRGSLPGKSTLES